MKKNTPSKLWFERRATDQSKRALRKRIKAAQQRASFQGFDRITAPKFLQIFDGRERRETLVFLQGIRRLVINGARKVLIDFTNVKSFASGATLLLLAELSRMKHSIQGLELKGIAPRNGKAAQVMKQTGLAKLLRMSISAVIRDHDVVNWKCASGQGAIGEKCDELLGPYDGVIAEALSDHLYRGLTEAMTNAHHHAYFNPRGDGIQCDPDYKPWWMFSQEKDGELTVVFCDLGLGIPTTLPIKQPKWWEKIVRFGMSGMHDGKLIQGAVRNSRSRTRKMHRGKGLRQIADTISTEAKGVATIYSNRGVYMLRNKKEETYDHGESIMGTIIQWRMPLPEEHTA